MNALLVLIHTCYAYAAVAGLARQEIIFTPAQEYSLLNQLGVDAQTPLELINPRTTGNAFSVKARPTTIYRPRDPDSLQHTRWRSRHLQESERVEWEPTDVLAPDVEDRHTLAQLARMTGNAYALPGQKNWYDMDPAWNTVRIFLAELLVAN